MNFTLKFFVDLSPVWQPAAILVSVSLNINVLTELFFTSVCCVFTRNFYYVLLESSWTDKKGLKTVKHHVEHKKIKFFLKFFENFKLLFT